MMITLIYIELLKIFNKWRTYIGFLAIAILVPLVQMALHFEGDSFINSMTRRLQDSFIISGNLLNGYLIGHLILNSLFIHIPFLIVLVGGDLLAGEATAGTFRLLLTRPVSRFKILLAKFIAGVLYTASLLLFLALMSLGVSLLFFGTGDLIVFTGKIVIFSKDDLLWRFLLAYGFAFVSMTTVFALSFLASSLVENAIGPIVASMSVIIVLFILSALNFQFIDTIRPYLFVSHMNEWNKFFSYEIDYTSIFDSLKILLIYIIAFFGIAYYVFRKKDILT
jgi:ABC-2 type transport system permease protein